MRKIIDTLAKKPTVISVIGISILAIGIPSGIYGLTLEGGASLGGALILMGVLFSSILLMIDRAVVNIIELKKLNLIETVLLVIGVLTFLYEERKIEINVNPNLDYFVLIENNGRFENSELKYKFPFDKTLIPNERNGIINSISDNFQQIRINWAGYQMRPRKSENIEVQFYSKYDSKLEEDVIDSLIKIEIKSLVNF